MFKRHVSPSNSPFNVYSVFLISLSTFCLLKGPEKILDARFSGLLKNKD
jgi:hypothetical protein